MGSGSTASEKAQIQSLTTLGKVSLADRLPSSQFQVQTSISPGSTKTSEWLPVFQEVTQDDVLRVQLPARPLYPGLPAYLPVLISFQPGQPLRQFIVRLEFYLPFFITGWLIKNIKNV
jgi:hypothetical protein